MKTERLKTTSHLTVHFSYIYNIQSLFQKLHVSCWLNELNLSNEHQDHLL